MGARAVFVSLREEVVRLFSLEAAVNFGTGLAGLQFV